MDYYYIKEEITEAIQVAAAIKAGAAIVHRGIALGIEE